MNIHPGDTIRIGKGYQRWTVLNVDGTTLTVRSSASYQNVASGFTTQTRTVDASRVTVLQRAEPKAAPKPKAEETTFSPEFQAEAERNGLTCDELLREKLAFMLRDVPA